MDVLGIAGTVFAIIILLVASITYRRGYDDGCHDGMMFAGYDFDELDVPESA